MIWPHPQQQPQVEGIRRKREKSRESGKERERKKDKGRERESDRGQADIFKLR